jgi:GTPase SAR1 family protein
MCVSDRLVTVLIFVDCGMSRLEVDAGSGSAGDSAASEQQYKVLVVGDYAVGKVASARAQPLLRQLTRHPQTSIIRRTTDGSFTPNYKLTIGVDFAVKVRQSDRSILNGRLTRPRRPQKVALSDNSTVHLQLWCAV